MPDYIQFMDTHYDARLCGYWKAPAPAASSTAGYQTPPQTPFAYGQAPPAHAHPGDQSPPYGKQAVFQQAVICPTCGNPMAWSDEYSQPGYSASNTYVCNVCEEIKAGKRWYCKPCENDFCGNPCMPTKAFEGGDRVHTVDGIGVINHIFLSGNLLVEFGPGRFQIYSPAEVTKAPSLLPKSINLSGAHDPHSVINGLYHLCTTEHNGMPMWRVLTSNYFWLLYNTKSRWCVTNTGEKDANNDKCYIEATDVGHALPTVVPNWAVFDGKAFQVQDSVHVDVKASTLKIVDIVGYWRTSENSAIWTLTSDGSASYDGRTHVDWNLYQKEGIIQRPGGWEVDMAISTVEVLHWKKAVGEISTWYRVMSAEAQDQEYIFTPMGIEFLNNCFAADEQTMFPGGHIPSAGDKLSPAWFRFMHREMDQTQEKLLGCGCIALSRENAFELGDRVRVRENFASFDVNRVGEAGTVTGFDDDGDPTVLFSDGVSMNMGASLVDRFIR